MHEPKVRALHALAMLDILDERTKSGRFTCHLQNFHSKLMEISKSIYTAEKPVNMRKVKNNVYICTVAWLAVHLKFAASPTVLITTCTNLPRESCISFL